MPEYNTFFLKGTLIFHMLVHIPLPRFQGGKIIIKAAPEAVWSVRSISEVEMKMRFLFKF